MSQPAFPEPFATRMQHQLGNAWPEFLKAHAQPAPVSIRLHPRKTFSHPAWQPVPWSSFGYYLRERPTFTLDPMFHAGAYYVQEASSMFLDQALKQTADLSQPLNALDLSAAPGGKSTHLLSLLHAGSLLVANEVIRSRAAILSENIQKWGYPNCLVTSNDPKDFGALPGCFDLIVVDAPCSGEGLFRKDPDAVNAWSTENADLCAARQKRILHDVWPALKENGILIYCTCTYNEAENEQNLVMLRNELGVEFLPLKTEPAWGVEKVEKDGIIGYRFLPHRVAGEGFFLSVMRKTASQAGTNMKGKKKLQHAPKKITEGLRTWIHHPEAFTMLQHQDLVFALPASVAEDVAFMLNRLKFIYAGCNIATVKHDKLIPEHALAVSTIVNREAFTAMPVSLDEALQYLRRETLAPIGNHKGYNLVMFEDRPLGWVNALSNRLNNLYPQEWRIRMSR